MRQSKLIFHNKQLNRQRHQTSLAFGLIIYSIDVSIFWCCPFKQSSCSFNLILKLWCACNPTEIPVYSLIEKWYRCSSFGFLHHVGLVSKGDVNYRRCQLTRLAIHLHGDRLIGGESDLTTLI